MKHILFVVAVFLLLISCSGQINGTLKEDGSAEVTIQTALQPSMTALIRALYKQSADESKNLIDAGSIGKSLSTAPGVKSINLRNINTSSISGTISLSNVNDFLAVPNLNNQKFINYEKTSAGGKLAIALNRNISPSLVSLLSPDLADYLSCLMAPAAVKDYQYIKTKTAYLEELKSFYKSILKDKKLADSLVSEISAAHVRLTIDFPKNIGAVQGGSFSGKRTSFDIPLLDLLVLETPLRYEVTW